MSDKTVHVMSTRKAKEFLVAKIVEEAEHEGIALSEVERKMLYFSETAWTLPDIMETQEKFNRDYNQKDYEKKIERIIRNARKANKQDLDTWQDAIQVLDREDHYLLVMIRQAGTSVRPGSDLFRLWATALAISCALFFFFYLMDRLGYLVTREYITFYIWAIVASVTVIYLLLCIFMGRKRANELRDRLQRFFSQSIY